MPIVKHSIDEKTARRMIKAAIAKADEMNKKVSVAITNEAGQLKAFTAMDGAGHLTIGISQDKAYSASAFGIATHVWWDIVKNDPPLLHGITHTPRLTIFGGGYPIRIDGEIVGAIGVSGGHYSEDMEIARAALSAVDADIT